MSEQAGKVIQEAKPIWVGESRMSRDIRLSFNVQPVTKRGGRAITVTPMVSGNKSNYTVRKTNRGEDEQKNSPATYALCSHAVVLPEPETILGSIYHTIFGSRSRASNRLRGPNSQFGLRRNVRASDKRAFYTILLWNFSRNEAIRIPASIPSLEDFARNLARSIWTSGMFPIRIDQLDDKGNATESMATISLQNGISLLVADPFISAAFTNTQLRSAVTAARLAVLTKRNDRDEVFRMGRNDDVGYGTLATTFASSSTRGGRVRRIRLYFPIELSFMLYLLEGEII